ncbi:MAG: VOC family protein [Bdellovibrionales bacterium]|nr:VOC family protein [Bdellovibrionales bacterium]
MIFIDHIFMFIRKESDTLQTLKTLGLTETYTRRHLGQGTANSCYAFNNMFLEFIWLEDESEILSEQIKATGLYERSKWMTSSTCPFGIAYRNTESNIEIETPHWDFKPTYLPTGKSIRVTEDSKNPIHPMIFKAISVVSPAEWTHEKRGRLQSDLGLEEIDKITISTPQDYVASPSLLELLPKTDALKIKKSESSKWNIEFEIDTGKNNRSVIYFPDLTNSKIIS